MEMLVPVPAFETDHTCSKRELRAAVDAIETGERLAVHEVAGMLNHNPDAGGHRAEIIATIGVPGALLAGHIATETVVEQNRDNLPTLGTLPDFWHQMLSNVAELPFFDQDQPVSAAVRDHLPNLFLFAAGTYLGLEAARFLRGRSFYFQMKAAQATLLEAYQQGSLAWNIESGSSVAFIGDSHPLAKEVAHANGRDILQISYNPVDGPWTRLPRYASFEETLQAVDRADLANAGELLFFPIKPHREFLPHPGDHDISVDRIVNYIIATDIYRDGLDLPRLPVIVVGSKRQLETYVKTSYGRAPDEDERCVTLEQRMAALALERGKEISVFDTTEIIIDKIFALAGDRRLIISGTKRSIEEYGDEFFVRTLGRHAEDQKDSVRIIYNNNEFPTISDATPDDICVVLDAGQKESLTHRGIPADQIVVVSEEVIRAVSPLINQN